MHLPYFSSERITKTSTITLNAPIQEVFQLFGPLQEKEWAAGWEPEILFPTNARVEEHMVFKTSSPHVHGEPDYTWIITKYQPDQAAIEYTIFTPERVWCISIQCTEHIPQQSTKAAITYTFTGLTSRGNAINAKALQQMYLHELKDWEEAINHYLATGTRLSHT